VAGRNIFRGTLVCTKKKQETSSPKPFSPKNSIGTEGCAPKKEVSPARRLPPPCQHSCRHREAVHRPSRGIRRPLFFPPARIGREEERQEGVAALHRVGPREDNDNFTDPGPGGGNNET